MVVSTVNAKKGGAEYEKIWKIATSVSVIKRTNHFGTLQYLYPLNTVWKVI
jgi:hypothetical protein